MIETGQVRTIDVRCACRQKGAVPKRSAVAHDKFGNHAGTANENKRNEETDMKRLSIVLLGIAVVAAALAPTVNHHFMALPVVHAHSGCSVATLKGDYGFTYTGFVSNPGTTSPTKNPIALVGPLTFDGEGNWSSSNYSVALNGKMETSSTSPGSTYTVNSDCTGNMTEPGADSFNFVIVAGGAEVMGIDITPGDTSTWIAKKQ